MKEVRAAGGGWPIKSKDPNEKIKCLFDTVGPMLEVVE